MVQAPTDRHERIVPREIARYRLRNELLEFYRRDPRYRNIVVQDLGELWRAVRQADEERPLCEAAVSATIANQLRLVGLDGQPAGWARSTLYHDVRAAVEPPGWDRWVLRVPGGQPNRQGWFELTVSPTFVRFNAPGLESDVEFETGIGAEGFGEPEWDDLKKMVRRLVDEGLGQLRADFEDAYGSEQRWRPSSRPRRTETVQALYRFLFHDQAGVNKRGPASRRALRERAALIEIRLPARNRRPNKDRSEKSS